MNKLLIRLCAAAAITGLVGCGAVLYPERAGQPKGRIDPAVAILDGIGVLLFIIPGLIAFAVDFHQGTIYLPPGEAATNRWRPVPVTGPLTRDVIEAAVSAQIGSPVWLEGPDVRAYRLHDIAEAPIAGSL